MGNKITDWEQIIGHKNIVNFLRKSIANSTIPNVCLFYGNPGLGKSSIAKLVAVDLISRGDSTIREKQVKAVILNDESTTGIKIFNMSNISDKEDEIVKVISELTLGFSEFGRKVLILDESHGMSKKAQDALLPKLEYLEDGIFVFLCTTDISMLRDALLSRCRKIPLRSITVYEISNLIRKYIKDRQLRFTLPTDTVVTMIAYYCNNSPREVVNLLDCYEVGQVVSAEDLSVFIETDQCAIIVQLVYYLYNSMTLGLEYIETLQIDTTFPAMLNEVCRSALGGDTKTLPIKDRQRLSSILVGEDITNLLMFTANVLGSRNISKRTITSAFIKSHKMVVDKPKQRSDSQVQYADLSTIQEVAENVRTDEEKAVQVEGKESELAVPSLMDLLNNSLTVR